MTPASNVASSSVESRGLPIPVCVCSAGLLNVFNVRLDDDWLDSQLDKDSLSNRVSLAKWVMPVACTSNTQLECNYVLVIDLHASSAASALMCGVVFTFGRLHVFAFSSGHAALVKVAVDVPGA